MTSGSPAAETALESAVLEVERFEWTTPDRIELTGVWSGVRGRRFIRPTLVLFADGERRRLLALLEHKPWSADDGADWTAAFAWDGEPVKADRAELHVATGIDLELPPPRHAPGKAPPRRFRHRAVAHDDAGREEIGTKREEKQPKKSPDKRRADAELERLQGELDAALVRATAAEVRVGELKQERDQAVARRKALASELAEVRQGQEEAVRIGRAEEREIATKMLAEGAQLRASVERQREMAYAARDAALQERDTALEHRDRAILQRKEAMADRKEAFRERDSAFADRDRAIRDRDQALAARLRALEERDQAKRQRDAARSERDTIVSVQERGLPVVQPQPRHLPATHQRTELEIWLPRAAAAGALLVLLVLVLRLVAGL
jgi:hypothetical protein